MRAGERDTQQHDRPVWEPLLTRRYLHLTEDGRAFELAACGRYVPLRLDSAIQAALCTWWILAGWEEADVAAVRQAIVRAQSSTPGAEG